MKKLFTVFACVPVLLFSFAAPVIATEDITPTVRSMSEIRAQYLEIIAQLEKVRDLLAAQVSASINTESALFTITVDGEVLESTPVVDISKSAAQTACEAVAYNTEYMWQLVGCEYAGEVLYNDVFIAG